jgi:predicted ATPase/DNA-binding SARP family transcriptional activator
VDLLEIGLLGTPRFAFRSEPWRLSAPPKCLPLLALLVLRAEPLSRASLAATLWPDHEHDARANLRRHLHALGKALPPAGQPWFFTSGETAQWNPQAAARIDVVEFERAAEAGTRDALTWYRGELLAGIFDEAIVGERERLAETHQNLLSDLAHAALAARDFASATEHASALLALDDWREDAVRVLMTARYSLGDRSGALALFDRFARRLASDLNTDPMFETVALRDAIAGNVLAVHAPRASDDAPPAMQPLAGRRDELATLQAAWQHAASWRGNCVFVSGDAGIGKTRLAFELASFVEAQGGRAVFGRSSDPEPLAYQPIVDVLRGIMPFLKREGGSDAWLAALLPILPDIARLYDDLPALAKLESVLARLRLHEAVTRAVESCARTRPLALILEDLHHANVETLDIVSALAERIKGLPVLLVLTYRTGLAPASSPVRKLRRHLQRASFATHLELGPMSDCDIASLIETECATHSRTTLAHLIRASEGNPLFALQLAHYYAERSPGDDAVLALSDVVIERLQPLGPGARTIAEVAAVIGATFTAEEIAEIGGISEAIVEHGLATLTDYRLIAPHANSGFEYAFTHSLIRAAVYERLEAERQRALHRRAAAVIAQTRSANGMPHRLIADHWERAGERERARESYLAAARSAREGFARHEAIELARRAIAFDAPAAQRFEANLIIYRSLDRTSEGEAALAALEELESLCAHVGDEARYETLYARYDYHRERGELDEQTAALDAFEAFVRDGAPQKRARAALARAALLLQLGRTAACTALLREHQPLARTLEPADAHTYSELLAISLFRQTKPDEARAVLDHLRAELDERPSLDGEYALASAELTGAWIADDPAALERCGKRFIRLAEQRGDLLAEARGRAYLAYLKHQLHDTKGAREDYRHVLALYERANHRANVLITRLNAGMVEFEAGHIDRAAAMWSDVARAARTPDCATLSIALDINLAEVELLRRRPEQAIPLARRALEAAQATGDGWLVASAHGSMGAAECAQGMLDRGLPKLRMAVRAAREQSRNLLSYLTHFVDALCAAGPSKELREAEDELEDLLRDDPEDVPEAGRACWALAKAARVRGDEETARSRCDWGRQIVEARATLFDDPDDRSAYLRMPANWELCAGITPGMRTLATLLSP